MEYIYPLNMEFTLRGGVADQHLADLYDLARALRGVQRTLAITTHFILNDEVITQAPALRGAMILTHPAEEGSFRQNIKLAVILGALWTAGTANSNSVLGNIIYSAYDYVIKSTLGFHVDLRESLYKQYLQHEALKREIKSSQMDSVVEKCEEAVKEIHRPIYASGTATSALIKPIGLGIFQDGLLFNRDTYDRIRHERLSPDAEVYHGRVSSFSANTKAGKVFTLEEKRSIPFEIADGAIMRMAIFSESLDIYTRLQDSEIMKSKKGFFQFKAKRVYSANNTTRRYVITEVYEKSLIRNVS